MYEPGGDRLGQLAGHDWEKAHVDLERRMGLFDMSEQVFDDLQPEKDPGMLAAFLNSKLLGGLAGKQKKALKKAEIAPEMQIMGVELPAGLPKSTLRDAMLQWRLRHTMHPHEALAVDWLLGQLEPSGFEIIAVKVPEQSRLLLYEALIQFSQTHAELQLDAAHAVRMHATLEQLTPRVAGLELTLPDDGHQTEKVRSLVCEALTARLQSATSPRDISQEEGLLLQQAMHALGEAHCLVATAFPAGTGTKEFKWSAEDAEMDLKAEIEKRADKVRADNEDYMYDDEIFTPVPLISRTKPPDLVMEVKRAGQAKGRGRLPPSADGKAGVLTGGGADACKSFVYAEAAGKRGVSAPRQGRGSRASFEYLVGGVDGGGLATSQAVAAPIPIPMLMDTTTPSTTLVATLTLGAPSEQGAGRELGAVHASREQGAAGGPAAPASIASARPADREEVASMQMDTIAIRPPPGDTGAAAAGPSSAQSAGGCGRALVRQPSSLAEESSLGEPSFSSLAAPPPGHLAPPPAALEALLERAEALLERGSPSPFEAVLERGSPSPFEPVLERASPSLSPPPSPPLFHPTPPSVPPSPPAEKHEGAQQQAVTDIEQASRHPIGMGKKAAGSEGGREGAPGTAHSVDEAQPTTDAGDGSGQEVTEHRRMLSHESTQRAMRAWWRRRRKAAGDSEARMPCWKQYFVLFLGSLVVGACAITVTVLFAIIPPVTQYFVLFSFAGSVPTSLMLHIVTRSAVRYVRKRRALARGRSVEGAFTWQRHAAKHTTTKGFRRVRKGSEQEQQQVRRLGPTNYLLAD